MGIFNNGGNFNSLITAIQSLNVNLPIFRQCQHYRINVNPGVMQLIIEQTAEPKARRITIKNAGDSVTIFKGENITELTSAFNLLPGERLNDDRDGGISWYAMANNGTILDIAIELPAENTNNEGSEEEMPIEFKAHAELATGSNFAYGWLGGDVDKFNSVMAVNTTPPISGKILLLDSFQPGSEQIFNVIPPDDTSWLADDPDEAGIEPRFIVRLLNPIDISMAIMSEAWRYFIPSDFKRIMDHSINRKVGVIGGATLPIPLSYSSLCMAVCVDTLNHGHRACVFEWENTTQTFKILGY